MKLFGSSFFSRSLLRSERGLEAVELAVILPVFVGMIFGFIDVARMVTGFSAVRTAAALGGRYAVADQRPEWLAVSVAMGGGAANEVAVSSTTLQIKPEFVSDEDYAYFYPQQCTRQGINNCELYRYEIRAIGYANRILAETIGAEARYPCRTAGCFYCFTLRGDFTNYDKYFSMDLGSSGQRRWTSRTLGMTCTYRVPILTSMVGLGWLPSSIPVTGRAYIPINDYAGVTYEPDKNPS